MERFFRHPWLIVTVIGVLTVFFAFQLPKAELDNNNLRFVPVDDEARRVSEEIDETFGSSLFILVGLERKFGSVFEGEFLRRLGEYVERVEGIEIVDPVSSMVTADYITSQGDAILVEKLVPPGFSGTDEEAAELKRRLLSWDLYRRSLISDDFTATQVLIPLNISTENAGRPEVIASFVEIRDLAREMFAGIAEVYVTGLPVISATINEAVRADLLLLVPLVILVVLLVLFFSFRRLTAVLLPTLTVVVAVIWSMGAMPLLGVRLSVISTVLPVILVAVGSAYGIHVVTHYMEDWGDRREMDRETHRRLVLDLLRRIGKPVFLAALTTFVGFVSFCFTRVLPIREWGFFASLGVLVSFAVALTLIPSLLLLRGPRPLREAPPLPGGGSPEERLPGKEPPVEALFQRAVRRKRLVLIVTALFLFGSIWGLSHLVIDNIFVEYFRDDTDISRSDRFIREKFGGSKVVSVVVQADTDTLLMPESLAALDGLGIYLEERVEEAGKVMGFTNLIKRINQVYNAGPPGEGLGGEELVPLLEAAAGSGNSLFLDGRELVERLKALVNYQGAAYYEIPLDPAKYGAGSAEDLSRLVGGYLILIAGSSGSYADDPLDPTAIKTTVQLRTLGEEDTGRVIAKIRDYVAARFPPSLEVTIGGSALVVQSQLISVFVSLFLVFLIISISNRSPLAGLIGVIPLGITIMVNFGVMGLLGIKLNIGTSMVASLSVGIGIDYTIHYLEAFKREYRLAVEEGLRDKGERERVILRRTFTTSGKAIMINAVSVGLGFAALLFSRFVMLQDLGLLITLTMGTSALVSLTVIPVLLTLINPRFIRGQISPGEEK